MSEAVKLSSDERKKVEKKLSDFDTDGSGKLDARAVEDLIISLGYPSVASESKSLVAQYGDNGSANLEQLIVILHHGAGSGRMLQTLLKMEF